MKIISQLSQSVSALNAFLGTFYLFVLLALAATDAPAGEPDDHHIFEAAMVDIALDGEMTDAMNHLQSELGRPPVAEVRYDVETDRMYWTGTKTGKAMSMDSEKFYKEIIIPFWIWSKVLIYK
jgi:hypothetical protein